MAISLNNEGLNPDAQTHNCMLTTYWKTDETSPGQPIASLQADNSGERYIKNVKGWLD
jgi:hypothetical protein